jgi:hypothetical protein
MMTVERKVYFRPGVYAPHDGPFYWRDETSGELRRCVSLFLNRLPMAEEEIELIRQYFEHWICCPIWDRNPEGVSPELNILRGAVKNLGSDRALRVWLELACEIGIYPL